EIHRLTIGAEDQMVMWELLVPAAGEGGEPVGELVPADLPVLEPLIEEVRPLCRLGDCKVECLRRLLADQRSTLIFTVSYDTVRYLRDQLDQPGLAWCTGTRAGIGRTALPRESVLRWFQPESDTEHLRGGGGERSRAPRHLISTDVTAEGLNLQRAERVVHYDLPWTRVRMTQRDGRTVRRGSPHSVIEVVRFDPPPLIEQRLRMTRLLEAKAELSVKAGLADRGGRPWQWRDRLVEAVGVGPAIAGVARVKSEHAGVLAGFRLCRGGESGNLPLLPAVLLWLAPDGTWSEDPDFLLDRLMEAMGEASGATSSAGEIEAALNGLAAPIRARLHLAARDRWFASRLAPEARRLIRRLRDLAGPAARRRDASALRMVDRALRFVAGGHTAGEAALVRRLAGVSDRVLRGALATLPAPTAGLPGMEPRLAGLITFSPCRSSLPSCSISTER
ncbi:MAG: C-terminal helicase domain-containing protein, partial [Gemmatimonadales bacterium]